MIEDGPGPEGAAELPLEERLSDAALAAVMGDPYEVGLRIALDDGVAAAVPAVVRELAALDRAVGVVRSGLAGLVAAPAAVLPPVPAVGAVGAAAAPGPARAAAGPATEVPVSRGAVAAPVPGMPVAAMPQVLRAAERAAAEGLPQAAPLPPALALPEPKAAAPDWRNVEWAGFAALPGVAPQSAATPGAPAAAPMAAPEEAPVGAAGDRWPAPAWPGGAPRSAAPPALPPALLSPPDFAEPAAPAQPAEAAEAAPEERGVQGVLEIDGARLGRFVADHLAREAGRPPAGMTGFDPLLSPQWAGALQG